MTKITSSVLADYSLFVISKLKIIKIKNTYNGIKYVFVGSQRIHSSSQSSQKINLKKCFPKAKLFF